MNPRRSLLISYMTSDLKRAAGLLTFSFFELGPWLFAYNLPMNHNVCLPFLKLISFLSVVYGPLFYNAIFL